MIKSVRDEDRCLIRPMTMITSGTVSPVERISCSTKLASWGKLCFLDLNSVVLLETASVSVDNI